MAPAQMSTTGGAVQTQQNRCDKKTPVVCFWAATLMELLFSVGSGVQERRAGASHRRRLA